MSDVPSTPTAADRTMESRRIADETAKAKAQLEMIDRSVKAACAAGTQAQNRVEGLLKEAETLEEKIRKLSEEEVVSCLVNCINVMKGVVANVDVSAVLLKKVEERAIIAHETLGKVEKKIADLHLQNVRENEEIERKTNDLNIYHARLKKYFDEYLPGQIITI